MAATKLPDYAPAELYDLIYSWYHDDVDFYVAAAKATRGPVLEVGCGTGRILIPSLQAGAVVDGVDLRQGMLDVLRRKAEALGLKPKVYQGDMRDFTMPRKYALVTMPFRVFQHAMTTEDQLKVLRCIREHLESGGRLVFNVFHPGYARIAEPDGEQKLEREFQHPETQLPVTYYARVWRDRVQQTMRAEVEIQEADARGYVGRTHRYEYTLRWVFKAEMELLLYTAGFSRFEVKGGFDGRPLENETDEMVWTAWRD
jgi:SAM-dependent methyltransferase